MRIKLTLCLWLVAALTPLAFAQKPKPTKAHSARPQGSEVENGGGPDNLGTVPFSEMKFSDRERTSHALTKRLTQSLAEDIRYMKTNDRRPPDMEAVKALQCLQDNMRFYVSGADDTGITSMTLEPSTKITPDQFEKFISTIANSVRFNATYAE